MRRHHTGSGRRTAIPSGWEDAHAPVVTANYQSEATVGIRKPGGTSAWDETAGRTVTQPFLPFADNVPARITPITASQVAIVEEQGWVLGYQIAVPKDLAPTSGQLDEGIEVIVRTCSDPMLVGVAMRVSEVVRGTHRFERVLIASANS